MNLSGFTGNNNVFRWADGSLVEQAVSFLPDDLSALVDNAPPGIDEDVSPKYLNDALVNVLFPSGVTMTVPVWHIGVEALVGLGVTFTFTLGRNNPEKEPPPLVFGMPVPPEWLGSTTDLIMKPSFLVGDTTFEPAVGSSDSLSWNSMNPDLPGFRAAMVALVKAIPEEHHVTGEDPDVMDDVGLRDAIVAYNDGVLGDLAPHRQLVAHETVQDWYRRAFELTL